MRDDEAIAVELRQPAGPAHRVAFRTVEQQVPITETREVIAQHAGLLCRRAHVGRERPRLRVAIDEPGTKSRVVVADGRRMHFLQQRAQVVEHVARDGGPPRRGHRRGRDAEPRHHAHPEALRHIVRADVGGIAAVGPRALERDVGLDLGFAHARTIHPLETRHAQVRIAFVVRCLDDHLDAHRAVLGGNEPLGESSLRARARDELASLVRENGEGDVGCRTRRRTRGQGGQHNECDEGAPHLALQHRVGRSSRGS